MVEQPLPMEEYQVAERLCYRVTAAAITPVWIAYSTK
jgi:hypothetical protein